MIKLLACFLVVGSSAFAFSENLCSSSFDDEIGTISKTMHKRTDPLRWDKYGKFLKKFGNCLDGSYAETIQGVSEEALAEDWTAFTAYVSKKKPESTILRGVQTGFALEMSLTANLKKIQNNAKKYCPSVISSFCTEILKAKFKIKDTIKAYSFGIWIAALSDRFFVQSTEWSSD
ncbi:MAG: hypothetical protein HOO06_04125 [Bdellovibrionaceae bacterium]|nr:hypothetical protein [Pseudobdellovibrionaceae bacterium]